MYDICRHTHDLTLKPLNMYVYDRADATSKNTEPLKCVNENKNYIIITDGFVVRSERKLFYEFPIETKNIFCFPDDGNTHTIIIFLS